MQGESRDRGREEGRRGQETSSSDVLRSSVRLRHPVTADFILEVPPSVKNRMDLSGGRGVGWGGGGYVDVLFLVWRYPTCPCTYVTFIL